MLGSSCQPAGTTRRDTDTLNQLLLGQRDAPWTSPGRGSPSSSAQFSAKPQGAGRGPAEHGRNAIPRPSESPRTPLLQQPPRPQKKPMRSGAMAWQTLVPHRNCGCQPEARRFIATKHDGSVAWQRPRSLVRGANCRPVAAEQSLLIRTEEGLLCVCPTRVALRAAHRATQGGGGEDQQPGYQPGNQPGHEPGHEPGHQPGSPHSPGQTDPSD